MLQKSARLQYALLALVAILAPPTSIWAPQTPAHGQIRARIPFFGGFLGPAVANPMAEATAAGLQPGYTILTVNGHPFTGKNVLLQQVRQSQPHQPLTVTFHRHGTPPQTPAETAVISLAAERDDPASAWTWVLQSFFLLLPFFCLLTGLYVVFARPRSMSAWLILGILGFFTSFFIPVTQLYSPLRPLALFWSTAMPLSLMAFRHLLPGPLFHRHSLPLDQVAIYPADPGPLPI
jgi:phosphoserine phosphatase RsbU/P